MKEFEVTFTLNHTEIVEADSKSAAEQEFSELFSEASDLLEYGNYIVKRVGAVKKEYLFIDAYTQESRLISSTEALEWIEGDKPVKGSHKVWNCEEAIIIKL